MSNDSADDARPSDAPSPAPQPDASDASTPDAPDLPDYTTYADSTPSYYSEPDPIIEPPAPLGGAPAHNTGTQPTLPYGATPESPTLPISDPAAGIPSYVPVLDTSGPVPPNGTAAPAPPAQAPAYPGSAAPAYPAPAYPAAPSGSGQAPVYPGSAAPTYPGQAPAYPSPAAPAYPGATAPGYPAAGTPAYPGQAPAYPGTAAPTYPGQAPAYPAPGAFASPYGYVAPPAPPSNGLAITSLILGIATMVFCWVPVLALLTGIAAIITGIVALRRSQSKGLAIAGLITGALGAIISLLMTIFMILGIVAMNTALEDVTDTYSSGTATDDPTADDTTTDGANIVDIRYVATISSGEGTLTWTESDTDVPFTGTWEETATFDRDGFTGSPSLFVNATDFTSDVSCEIYVDDVLVEQDSGAGFAICMYFDY